MLPKSLKNHSIWQKQPNQAQCKANFCQFSVDSQAASALKLRFIFIDWEVQ